jgi:hypothetical protein
MELTRSKKLFLGILGIAVAALLIDRLVLAPGEAGPQQASASAVPRAPASPPPAPAAAPASPGRTAPAADSPSVADRLLAMAASRQFDPADVGDAFAPRGSWAARLVKGKLDVVLDPAADFARNHRLMSLVFGEKGACAVINGKLYGVGEIVDGHKLVRLTPHSAVFQSNTHQVELTIDPETERKP